MLSLRDNSRFGPDRFPLVRQRFDACCDRRVVVVVLWSVVLWSSRCGRRVVVVALRSSCCKRCVCKRRMASKPRHGNHFAISIQAAPKPSMIFNPCPEGHNVGRKLPAQKVASHRDAILAVLVKGEQPLGSAKFLIKSALCCPYGTRFFGVRVFCYRHVVPTGQFPIRTRQVSVGPTKI